MMVPGIVVSRRERDEAVEQVPARDERWSPHQTR